MRFPRSQRDARVAAFDPPAAKRPVGDIEVSLQPSESVQLRTVTAVERFSNQEELTSLLPICSHP
jgi:hypothetical protein